MPQAGQPAPPRAQMLALTSYLLSYFPTFLIQSYFPTFFFPGGVKTEGTSKLGAFGGAKGFLEVPSASVWDAIPLRKCFRFVQYGSGTFFSWLVKRNGGDDAREGIAAALMS